MKQLLVFFILITFPVQSQEYAGVDYQVKNYPTYTSPQKLAKRIASDFSNDGDKIRAAFVWLTENIAYDLKAYYNPNSRRIRFKYKSEAEKHVKLQRIKDQLVVETFKKKKSICEGYAQAFKKLCDLLEIEAIVIKGYSRNSTTDIGTLPQKSNHVWNAVKLGGQWKLLDVTWAAGHAINRRWKKSFNAYYYFTKPKDLLRSHYPEQKFWQMVQKPISERTFANQPLIGQEFTNRNLQLISPIHGIITSKGNLTFTIKNISKDDVIGYVFKGEKYGKKATVTFINNIAKFSINIPNKKNNELYIFLNSEVILQYKLK